MAPETVTPLWVRDPGRAVSEEDNALFQCFGSYRSDGSSSEQVQQMAGIIPLTSAECAFLCIILKLTVCWSSFLFTKCSAEFKSGLASFAEDKMVTKV